MKQRCWTCKYIEKEDGERVNRNHAYTCLWPRPIYPLPHSITMSVGYREAVSRRYMMPDEGKTCPVWEPRTADAP